MLENKFISVEEHLAAAHKAFRFLSDTTIQQRAAFMYAVADRIEQLDDQLLITAHAETSLPLTRLQGEKARTIGQWRTYALAVEKGIYVDAKIDRADSEKGKSDLRKLNLGIGPVVVFGASNFPFAFSTAGGDTASAIGAGCPVLFKAHPAHLQTSRLMADVLTTVLDDFGWPLGIFRHVEGEGNEIGTYLVSHSSVKGVAFTGSFAGGKSLFDLANRREEPIPVFAEMGSVNPIFVFPELLAQGAEILAKAYISSLTLGVGQFCTNPGLLITQRGEDFERFKNALRHELSAVSPQPMLHVGILEHYEHNKHRLTVREDTSPVAEGEMGISRHQAQACVMETSARNFLNNPVLSEEVFGPFGLLVQCDSMAEMLDVATQLRGQLTVTIAATIADAIDHSPIVEVLKDKCGRILFNGMPTGVEVVSAMQHGGPYPATTDARFTSVGPDAVKRFLKPLAFQNWPDQLLPEELQDLNPLGITRMVDGVYQYI